MFFFVFFFFNSVHHAVKIQVYVPRILRTDVTACFYFEDLGGSHVILPHKMRKLALI